MTTTTASTGLHAVPRTVKPSRAGSRGSSLAPWLFLAPFLVLFAAFYLAPVGYAAYKSLFEIRRVGGTFGQPVEKFVGWDQYKTTLSDPDFLAGVRRVILYGVVQVTVMLGVALLLALLLDSTVARYPKVLRVVFFLPYAVPGVIAAILWSFLYDPHLSPLTAGLGHVGLHPDLLGAGLILWAIANVVTWTYAGYNMLVLYSALQAIDTDIYEAASIDGASGFAVAWRIKIPIIRPALNLTILFSIIGTLQLFTEPLVFRAVSTNVTSTYTPNLQAYSVASTNNYSSAAAISVTLALITFALSFIFLRLSRKGAIQ